MIRSVPKCAINHAHYTRSCTCRRSRRTPPDVTALVNHLLSHVPRMLPAMRPRELATILYATSVLGHVLPRAALRTLVCGISGRVSVQGCDLIVLPSIHPQ